MFFILQKENNHITLDIDLLVLKEELDKQKFQHQYIFMSLENMNNILSYKNKYDIKNAIPVGSLDFVATFLKLVHNVSSMNPIEVPNELRLDKFLMRKYSIINKEELLQKKGYWFVKSAIKLKDFSHLGLVEPLLYVDEGKEPFLKDGLYVFSEVKDILAEYRVFVYQDEIMGIQFYDGKPTIMPTPDEIKKIEEMTLRYMLNKDRPNAYSLDVAIIKTNTNIGRDLMVIECHPFCSLGLYGVNGSFLPYAYARGIEYYINKNTTLKPFSNF